jgi:hypothetical protein
MIKYLYKFSTFWQLNCLFRKEFIHVILHQGKGARACRVRDHYCVRGSRCNCYYASAWANGWQHIQLN